MSCLAKGEQVAQRRKLQAAYAHPAYTDAMRALERVAREQAIVNESAARSWQEGLEETLHCIGLVSSQKWERASQPFEDDQFD